MQIKVLVFGQLTDIIGAGEIVFADTTDTNALVTELTKRYPALANARYRIAVDKQTINTNAVLKDGSTVALLPPFSGG